VGVDVEVGRPGGISVIGHGKTRSVILESPRPGGPGRTRLVARRLRLKILLSLVKQRFSQGEKKMVQDDLF
jgi:hypothetical protein